MEKSESRRRQRLAFAPTWDNYYIRWTAAFLKQHKWRVDRLHDFDDLMQDAYLVFVKVCDTYPRVMDPGHFFSLYKRSMINKMHDRSCARSRHGKVNISLPEDVSDFFIGRIGEAGNAGYAAALLAELPEEMRLVVDYLTTNQSETPRRKRGQPRENLSMRVCRELGLPKCDPVADLKELLAT
jgi:hypothetical protein